MVEVTFNTILQAIKFYICIVVRNLKNFYTDRMKFLIFTGLCLHLIFMWCVISFPCGKVSEQQD